LTADPLAYWGILLSRDGKKIFVTGHDQRVELTHLDMRSQQFVPYLGGISVSELSFSRDGQWIAYTKVPEGGLLRSRVNGSEQLSLTASLRALRPQWSPDGKRIAFFAFMENGALSGTSRVYLVSADGGAPPVEALAKNPCYWPSWSPDGNSLVLNCAEDQSGEKISLYILDLRTRQMSSIPGSDGFVRPSFTPDGRSVVANDKHQISLFDLGQQKWRTLVAIENPFQPTFSRDGRYIYFVTEGKTESIFRLRVTDSKLEKVASRERSSDPHPWFSLAPDDSPMIVRDMSTSEIYALDWEAP